MQHHAPAERASPWAVASLLSSLIVFCPLATMIAPALGVKALADIRSRPGVGGARMAVAGIVIGLLVTFAWIGAAMWWDREVRRPILAGPAEELLAGFRNEIGRFKAGFHGRGAEAPDEEASAFLNELQRRYGRFHGMEQGPVDPDADPPEPGRLDPAIPYVLIFDRGLIEAEAEFVLFDDDSFALVRKWRSITVFDDELGDLTYP